MSPEIRIGDREREAAVSALGEHYAAGRLTKEEYDERAERAWAARTASAMAPLFADLPAPHAVGLTSARPTAPQAPPRPPARPRQWGRVPFVPVLLVVLGVAMLAHVPWPFLILLGWLLWRGLLFRWFGGRWAHHGSSHQHGYRRW
jgi:hypothetical protein